MKYNNHASHHYISENLCERSNNLNIQNTKEIKNDISIAYGRRCIPKFIEILLNKDNDDEHICKCLRLMIPQMNIQMYKYEALSKNIIDILFDIINERKHNKYIIDNCCQLLEKFCYTIQMINSFNNNNNVINTILKISPLHGSQLLKSILDNPGIKLEIKNLIIEILLELIKENDINIIINIISIFTSIAAKSNITGVDYLINYNIPELIAEINLKYFKIIELYENSSDLFRYISKTENGKMAMSNHSIIKCLSNYLKCGNELCMERATAAMASIVIIIKMKKMIFDECMSDIIDLTVNQNKIISCNALTIFKICCEDPVCSRLANIEIINRKRNDLIKLIPKFAM